LLVTGCAAITSRNALPEAAAGIEPEGFHNIRYWGDETASELVLSEPGSQGLVAQSEMRSVARRQPHLLAISGGAEDGALAPACWPAGVMLEIGRHSIWSRA